MKQLWFILRNPGNITIPGTFLKRVVCLLFVCSVLLFAGPGQVRAELPAPNWMPGFPLLAGNQVIAMWNPVPGAAKYNVYLNGEKVAESVAFQFALQAPEKSGEYKVVVVGVDGTGAEGIPSMEGIFKIILLEPPAELFAMVSPDSIGVRWDKAEGAIIYNIYRADEKAGEKKLVGSTQDTVYRDKEVEKNKDYYYFVASKDATGKESPHSKVLQAKIAVAKTVQEEIYELVPVRADYEVIKPKQELISPTDMVFYKGKIYLVDNSKRKVYIFDESAELVGSFGEEGYLDGQFMSPRGIDIHDGNIAVADMTREMVMIFNTDNAFVKEFELPKKDQLARPSFLAFTPKGTLLVVDGANFRVIEVDLDGNVLGEFGEKNMTPFFKLGIFGSPSYINVDKDGRIFIVDKSYGKVHVLDSAYKPLFSIGLDKGVGSIVDGGKVTFDYENGVVFVSDPMLATITGFNLTDGKYLFSLFDRNKTILKEYVPKWDIGSPRVLELDDSGKLWIIMGLNRALAKVNKFLDPLPQKSNE